MEISELDLLRVDLESDRVERKERISRNRDRVAQAICAFANDLPNHRAPGVVFVGIRDDGSCADLHVDDDLLLQLAAIRDDGNIQPLPDMTMQRTLPDYPLVALQQLVRNAVMHRAYEITNAPVRVTWFRDRVEIQSPGGAVRACGSRKLR